MVMYFIDTPPVKLSAVLIFLLLSSVQFFANNNVMAEENTKEATEQTEEPCKEPIKVQGPANLSSTMAEMNAIIFWHRKVAETYDKKFADWHKAKEKSVSCKKVKPSQYYYCKVAAQACKTDK